jgi:hypothetical protein
LATFRGSSFPRPRALGQRARGLGGRQQPKSLIARGPAPRVSAIPEKCTRFADHLQACPLLACRQAPAPTLLLEASWRATICRSPWEETLGGGTPLVGSKTLTLVCICNSPQKTCLMPLYSVVVQRSTQHLHHGTAPPLAAAATGGACTHVQPFSEGRSAQGGHDCRRTARCRVPRTCFRNNL